MTAIVTDIATRRPVGSVLPDSRGRVSLSKYLPPVPGVYLVYADPTSGVITLKPVPEDEKAVA